MCYGLYSHILELWGGISGHVESSGTLLMVMQETSDWGSIKHTVYLPPPPYSRCRGGAGAGWGGHRQVRGAQGTGLREQWKETAPLPCFLAVTYLTSHWVLPLLPKTLHLPSFPSTPPKHNLTQSSEAEPNLTANSQVQYESLWPQVRVSQAQHPKPGDCFSFKHQPINRAKPQENTWK